MQRLIVGIFLLTGLLPAMAYRDLETGQFLTRDPAGFVDGPNVYTYVRQNPWTKFDPEGLQEAPDDGTSTIGMPYTQFFQMSEADRNQYVQGYREGLKEVGPPLAVGAAATAAVAFTGGAATPELLAASVPARLALAGTSGGVGSVASTVTSNAQNGQPTTIQQAAQSYAIGATVAVAVQGAGEGLSVAVIPKPVETPPPGGQSAAATRLAQDAAVDPKAPAALPTNRPIGKSTTQNAEAQAQVQTWQQNGYTDIRVNQQQVNAQGQRVGVNRPDLQGTHPSGQREYIEYDTSASTRGPAHEARIKANDPQAKVEQKKVD